MSASTGLFSPKKGQVEYLNKGGKCEAKQDVLSGLQPASQVQVCDLTLFPSSVSCSAAFTVIQLNGTQPDRLNVPGEGACAREGS